MRLIKFSILTLLILVVLAACSSKDPAVQTVEAYLKAIVDQDGTALTGLVCEEWEFDAVLEMDSFLAVSPQLQDLSCSISGADADFTLVNCTGSILATYNDEKQTLDLSNRTFQVVENVGEWQVCGYQQP